MVNPEVLEGLLFFVAVFFGALGAVARILVQWKRDEELPFEKNNELYRELALGAIGGLLMWLMAIFPSWKPLAVAALGAGFTAADTIENLLTKK